MDKLEQMLAQMDNAAFKRLQMAVETGRWENGDKLSDEQRGFAMQATMLYQSRKLDQSDHLTIGADGNIIHKSKAQLKKQFSPDTIDVIDKSE